MKKIFFGTILSLFLFPLQAQNLSSSPFSALGLGDQLFDSNPELAAMGGLSAAVDGVFGSSVNFSNPAANHNLKWTTFNFGVNSDNLRIQSNQNSATNGSTYVSQLSLAFPIGEKTKLGFGFQPFTADGYSVRNITILENEPDFANDFEGEGGVNAINLIASRNITNNLSLGLRVNYLFGEINRREQLIVEESDLQTEYAYSNQISGLQFAAGAFYTKEFKDKKRLNLGLNYTIGANLNSDVENLTRTFFEINNIPTNVDTIAFTQETGASTTLPQEISVGVSWSKEYSYMIGAQLDFSNWSDFDLAGDRNPNIYQNSYKASLGGYWIPNHNSYKSYLNRITYRAGAYFQQSPFEIANTSINEYGITFGLGLPVGKNQNPSMLNMAFELGQRGTLSNNLIREDFFKFKVGFTLNAVWFRKRFYD